VTFCTATPVTSSKKERMITLWSLSSAEVTHNVLYNYLCNVQNILQIFSFTWSRLELWTTVCAPVTSQNWYFQLLL
jgi:hypothetical protein